MFKHRRSLMRFSKRKSCSFRPTLYNEVHINRGIHNVCLRINYTNAVQPDGCNGALHASMWCTQNLMTRNNVNILQHFFNFIFLLSNAA